MHSGYTVQTSASGMGVPRAMGIARWARQRESPCALPLHLLAKCARAHLETIDLRLAFFRLTVHAAPPAASSRPLQEQFVSEWQAWATASAVSCKISPHALHVQVAAHGTRYATQPRGALRGRRIKVLLDARWRRPQHIMSQPPAKTSCGISSDTNVPENCVAGPRSCH